MMVWIGLVAPSWACGGFFCNNVDPVVQSAERILFQEDLSGEWTAVVEVQFEGPPSDFAWVVPVASVLDPERDVALAPAGLFDELETLTAPRFVHASTQGAGALVADRRSGCGRGPTEDIVAFDTSGVEVVGEAVVGPYAIEVITAEEGGNLARWLQLNGYGLPVSAADPIDAYIDEGFAFVGVKLRADVPEGPIDTLVLRCGQSMPRIPLMLTAIASVPELPVTVYVQGAERYVPQGDWEDVAFDFGAVRWEGVGEETNYEDLLRAVSADQRGFVTEFSGPVRSIAAGASDEVIELLTDGGTLTRMRSFVSPQQMTSDPSFVADPGAPEVSNVHAIASAVESRLGWVGVVPLLALLASALLRRRTHR